MNNELRGIIVEETGNVGIGGANRVMNNERKPITRTVKDSEPWMPDQVQVRVRAWNNDINRTVTGWLVKIRNGSDYRYMVENDEMDDYDTYKHVEPIYEPAPKKTRQMTQLEAYVFLRDGGYVWRNRNCVSHTWYSHGYWCYAINPDEILYAEPKEEPLEWHEFPEVEVEVE